MGVKISNLPAVVTPAMTDIFPIVQAGVTYKETITQLSTLLAASAGTALTRTNDTNVTITLGGSPATALLNAASLTMGWTGFLSVARGGTGVGAVNTVPAATTWAGWDAQANFSAVNFLRGFSTTATSASTSTLTVASNGTQEYTGVTTQTVVLPVVASLAAGTQYYIINNSSGVVTVQSSGLNTIQAMASGTSLLVTCILTSGTGTASWQASYITDAGGTVNTGTANQLAYYASAGNAVSGLATAANGVLVTSAGSVPSISSTLPSGISATAMNLTSPKANAINDTNNAGALVLNPTASAVNYFQMNNNTAGSAPTLLTIGTDAAISMALNTKSTGVFRLLTEATTNQILLFSQAGYANTATLNFPASSNTYTFPSATGTLALATSSVPITQVVVQRATASGAGTYTPTAGMQYVVVQAQGGGGGSGGAATSGVGEGAGGNGGGGGGYTEAVFTAAQIGASKAYSVGAGGAGGAAGNNAGTAGDPTTFNTTWVVANGGGGGPGGPNISGAGTASTGITGGATGSVATGTALRIIPGGCGMAGLVIGAVGCGGFGGAAGCGAGGPASTNNGGAGGNASANSGAGASGASTGNSAQQAGGTGGSGFITFIEYLSV